MQHQGPAVERRGDENRFGRLVPLCVEEAGTLSETDRHRAGELKGVERSGLVGRRDRVPRALVDEGGPERFSGVEIPRASM
jgi:hypothetical protein